MIEPGTRIEQMVRNIDIAPTVIDVPSYQDKIRELRETMFADFEARGGLNAPLRFPTGERLDQRKLP